MEEPQKIDGHKVIREVIQQGTNPHLFWCTARSSEEDDVPALMIKQSAIDMGLVVDITEERGLSLTGPKELMVALMQDAYVPPKDGKPFTVVIPRDIIRSIQHGPDFIGVVLFDSWDEDKEV